MIGLTDIEKFVVAKSLVTTAIKDLEEGDEPQALERLNVAEEMLFGIDDSKLRRVSHERDTDVQ